MKKVITYVTVVMSYFFEIRKVVAKAVKEVAFKDPEYRFPNTWRGRSEAAKLRHTPGYEFATIILDFGRGTGLKLEHGMPVVLMAVIDPNVAIILVPNMSEDFHLRIDEAEAMIVAWTDDHDWVTVLTLQITDVTTKKDAYKASKGDARKGKFSKMMEAINGVMFLYQTLCNEDRDNCFAIAASGKFHIRGKGGKTDQIWELIKSEIAGEIILTGVVVDDHARTYNWWYSANGTDWVRMSGTYYAHTKMSGLTPNTYAWFRYELSLNDVPQGMSTELKIQMPA